jgi:hypothetical protein
MATVDYGSWVSLEGNGAAIANNAFGAANDASFDMVVDGGGRLHLQFELELPFSVAPSAGLPVALHHAPLDLFGGTDDGRDPSANNLGGYLEQVLVENTTTTQRFRFVVFNAPTKSNYWLQNAGTNQSIAAGWKLRARAWNPA